MRINVVYGARNNEVTFAEGSTVSTVYCQLKTAFSYPENPNVRVNGVNSNMDQVLTEGARVEFLKKTGSKG